MHVDAYAFSGDLETVCDGLYQRYERCQCIVFSTPHWMTVLILPTRTGDIFLQLEQFAFAALKKTFPEADGLSSAGTVFVQCNV